ncbi:MAG: proline--tRNA ligase [Candidatus Anoxymicrobium japonicum]|uniref:Proline--tRNA ligase n=1 Tax=Candidatus Anoxymicrobium japonicum TaxID=2013648 RepID=A0A2N3G7X4_9ACTN|nr:MAG: proline--tRNA ligase [Candidatus Anoxymicrobium japonicum]
MKISRVTVPTLKEKPAEAEVTSHELLLRAGMMRSFASGIYTLLPLGARALQKIEEIVREEMNSAGALEVALPFLHPSDPWMRSGRWHAYGPEMMRLTDRQGREFCLGPTAEELMTMTVARGAPSYRELPVNLYQIQTKFRDEMRPRFGLLRGREFRMMDAYSFHTCEEDLESMYEAMRVAYLRIADRCSLEICVVEASTGLIGGKVSHEFMVVSEVGEDILVYCPGCNYGANGELERHKPAREFGGAPAPVEEAHTPGMVSISELSAFLDVTPDSVLKCVLYVVEGEALAVFVPGYRDVSEPKLARALGVDNFHVMRDDERGLYPAITPGFTGPVGLAGARALFDVEVKGACGLVTGANRVDYHLRGAEEGRDFTTAPLADVAGVVDGDLCVACGSELVIARGIEIGHIFKLGLKYSEVLDAGFTDTDGRAKPIVMGTYGIGTSRMLQTIVEQHHDEGGIKWPRAVAPMPVEIIVIETTGGAQRDAAREIEVELSRRGIETLIDDRDVSPGIKFNDADLIGLPIQLITGKKLPASGDVELKMRYTGERRDVPVGEAAVAVERALREAR